MGFGEAGPVESAPRLALRDGSVDDRDGMRRTGMRPGEHHRPEAIAMRERRLLRHHAAERLTVDVCALDAELVDDASASSTKVVMVHGPGGSSLAPFPR
jgi:hypothetical protein